MGDHNVFEYLAGKKTEIEAKSRLAYELELEGVERVVAYIYLGKILEGLRPIELEGIRAVKKCCVKKDVDIDLGNEVPFKASKDFSKAAADFRNTWGHSDILVEHDGWTRKKDGEKKAEFLSLAKLHEVVMSLASRSFDWKAGEEFWEKYRDARTEFPKGGPNDTINHPR